MANELRVRSGFKKGTLGATLLIGGTTIDFGTNPGFGTIGSTAHAAIILDPDGVNGAPEIVYLIAYTVAGTTGTIVRAQEGTTARQHNSGTVWRHGPTLRDFPRAPVFANHSSNITISSTTWVDLQTSLDLSVAAQIGDVIRVNLTYTASTATAQNLLIDAVSLVGGTPQQSWAEQGPINASGNGVAGWFSQGSIVTWMGYAAEKLIVAADIDSGVVLVRMRARIGSAGSRTVNAGSTPLRLSVQNVGPQIA